MKTFESKGLISSAIFFSCSAHAATIANIDDNNITQYLNIGGKSLVAVDSNNAFKQTKKITLANGLVKYKYTQFYKETPLFSNILTSSELNGKKVNWFGRMVLDLQDDLQDVRPSFDKQQALSLGKKQFHIKPNTVVKNEEATLYIRINEQNKAELIYLVSFNIESDKPARPYYMIDAHTGKVINFWDGLTTKNAEGPGGNEKTGSYYYGRDFGSLNVSDTCEMKNTNVETYNMNSKTTGEVLYKFTCPVNTHKQINGAYSPLNDAHYFGGIVFDMYKNWYSIAPLKTILKLRIHYSNNYENAFWDGQQMTFGDGGSHMYPLTALDVMAHEVSHGVTEQNSGLVYQKQAGGINEAFSDMAGETAEDYMNKPVGKENDWLVGATIMKGSPTKALRYFKNPTADGVSIDNVSNYNDSLDVHFTSGVFNKAFYNLATKSTWDIKKAFGVFLAANQVYWEKEATFNSAACGVAKAAADLGYEVNDVITSFKDVGVDANCDMPDPDTGTETPINNGTVINNINVTNGDEHRYVLNVPVLRTYPYVYDVLSMRVYNSTGTAKNNAQLFVRYENGTYKPMTKMETAANGDEIFSIMKPAAGKYHILIKGKNTDTVSLIAFYGNFR